MQSKKIKFNNSNKDELLYVMSLFHYEFVKEDKHYLYFSREEDEINSKLDELEKEAFPKVYPMWIFIALIGISFALLTALLIILIINRDAINENKGLIALIICPSFSLGISVKYIFNKYKKDVEIINNRKNLMTSIENRIKILEKTYGKEEI